MRFTFDWCVILELKFRDYRLCPFALNMNLIIGKYSITTYKKMMFGMK